MSQEEPEYRYINDFFNELKEIVDIPPRMRNIGIVYYIKEKTMKIGKLGGVLDPIFYNKTYAPNCGKYGPLIRDLIEKYEFVFDSIYDAIKVREPDIKTFVIRYAIKTRHVDICKNYIGSCALPVLLSIN